MAAVADPLNGHLRELKAAGAVAKREMVVVVAAPGGAGIGRCIREVHSWAEDMATVHQAALNGTATG